MIRNTLQRWGSVSVLFHWLTAAFVIGMIASGVIMTKVLEPFSSAQFTAYQWHKTFGVLVFGMAAARLTWRFTAGRTPKLPTDIPVWQRWAAEGTHVALYGLLFAMPLLGWLLVSTAEIRVPTLLFGVIPLPHLTDGPNETLYFFASWGHWLGGAAFLGLIALHAGAALKHHFIERDDVLTRMLPRRS